MKRQSKEFSPALVFVDEQKGRLSFLNNAHPNSVAQVQLAMRSLGRALLVRSELPAEAIPQVPLAPIQLDNGKWLIAKTEDHSRLNGKNLKPAFDAYSSIPNDSVWLVVNKAAQQTTGATTPWVPQDASLLVADTVEARRVAALVLVEAMEQEKLHRAMLAPVQKRLTIAVPDEPEASGAGHYNNVGRENRVVIEWENGKKEGFWFDQLAGFNSAIKDPEHWLAHIWNPPRTAVRWQMISEVGSSKRRTSGWVISASRFGELLHTEGVGETLGEYVLLPQDRPSNSTLFAMRKSSVGKWTPVEIGDKDVVVDYYTDSRPKVIYRGPEAVLLRPTIVRKSGQPANSGEQIQLSMK